MSSKIKVIVYHPMQQHSYKTAQALIEKNILFSYCTSIYYNPKKFIYRLLNIILPKTERKKMQSRNNEVITPYVKTFSSLYGFLYLIIERLDKTEKFRFIYKMQDILSKKMGKKVARYAIKNNVDIIVGYDTWSYSAIRELKKKKSSIKYVIDFTSLYSEEIVNIINMDIKNNPQAKQYYVKSFEKFNKEYIDDFKYEKDNTNFIFSPSSVVDESLLKYGINKKQIYRTEYGTYFKHQEKSKKTDKKLIVFTYVGRISHSKGVHYLIKAFKEIDRNDYILQLVGSNIDNFEFNDERIKYLGVKMHDDIPKILKETDIFVTESLYDGFPLSILEGFSYNIPVICTEKTGTKDYVINGMYFKLGNVH